jgi:hypothetical protein
VGPVPPRARRSTAQTSIQSSLQEGLTLVTFISVGRNSRKLFRGLCQAGEMLGAIFYVPDKISPWHQASVFQAEAGDPLRPGSQSAQRRRSVRTLPGRPTGSGYISPPMRETDITSGGSVSPTGRLSR